MKTWPIPLPLVALIKPLPAQSEAALKEYFEGRTVTDGVDVYPGTARPLD
jgi:hypothetical protein